jgi:CheY-specific phosphatase CheX
MNLSAQRRLELIIVQSVQATWTTFLEARFQVIPSISTVQATQASAWLTAKIHVSGNWSVIITLYARLPTAKSWARHMFAHTSDECSDVDVIDTAGELVNIIAGGVKRNVDQAGSFSLPRVEIRHFTSEPQFPACIAEVHFEVEDTVFAVVIGRLDHHHTSTGHNQLKKEDFHALT